MRWGKWGTRWLVARLFLCLCFALSSFVSRFRRFRHLCLFQERCSSSSCRNGLSCVTGLRLTQGPRELCCCDEEEEDEEKREEGGGGREKGRRRESDADGGRRDGRRTRRVKIENKGNEKKETGYE